MPTMTEDQATSHCNKMINTPDRAFMSLIIVRNGASCLKDCYRMHQELYTAFPRSAGKMKIMFRVEDMGSHSVIIVQSPMEPRWEEAMQRTRREGFLQFCVKDAKEVRSVYPVGTTLKFRVRAHPYKYAGADDSRDTRKPRMPIAFDEYPSWFERRGLLHGFDIDTLQVDPMLLVYGFQWRKENP